LLCSERNWYDWNYNDGKFNTVFQPHAQPLKSFKDELLDAARSTVDTIGNPTLLFSGGAESELMLRSFLEIGANPNVVIYRYENEYNTYDVSLALAICMMLDVDFKIIDFNLQKFFENDAERISEIAQIDRPRALPYCKLLEISEGIPIIGRGEPNPLKLGDNWIHRCNEYDVGRIKYARAIGKQSIPEWFKWTPGLFSSYMQTKWFAGLINNKFNVSEPSTTKLIGYREAYPDLVDRTKKTGFELIEALIQEVDEFLSRKNNGTPYRQTVDRDIHEWRLKLLNLAPTKYHHVLGA
jgi:hypothetical protein